MSSLSFTALFTLCLMSKETKGQRRRKENLYTAVFLTKAKTVSLCLSVANLATSSLDLATFQVQRQKT